MKDLNTYLTFNGNCAEAVQFYAKCLGADLHMMKFGEGPPGSFPPDAKDRIMHARLGNQGRTLMMASDTMPGRPFSPGNNFSVAIEAENAQEAEKIFAALGENGQVTMPLQETFWAVRFGMLTDKFGINWMIDVGKPMQ